MVHSGSGTLTLSGSNNYTGGTRINAGAISFVYDGLGSEGSIAVAGNSTLRWASGNTRDISGQLVLNDGLTATFDTNGNNVSFSSPIAGTPLAQAAPLPPMEILQIIAVFRFMFPSTRIKAAGGREVNLRDLQSWMFFAGASSALIGNYLTTAGRPADEDKQMVRDLGLMVERSNAPQASSSDETNVLVTAKSRRQPFP